MNKQFYKSNLASETYLQNTIKYVLNEVSNLMKVCYGPYGSHVLIANNMGAEALKDGQRILSSFIPDSSISRSVIQSIKSVSNKQAEEIGDGTTTTILLLCELYNQFRNIITTNNISPTVFNKQLKVVINDILEGISRYTTPVVDDDGSIKWDILKNAIYTSVDANDELTDIILDMFKEMGSIDPLVVVDTSTTNNHRYELVKGIELDGSPISPEIFFNGYSRKNINSPKIIMVNGRIDLSIEYIMDLDNRAMQLENEYIFLCTGIDDDKLSTLISLKNANPAVLNRITFFQIRISASDDEFLDACAALGANPIDSETLNKVSSSPALMKIINNNMGSCEKSLVTEFCIRFNDPNSNDEQLKLRIDDIESKIDDVKNDPTSHNETLTNLENRKAFLSKNFAKLYIGGSSPQRRSINYELAKDGVLQAISCLKNGVVPGCNVIIPRIILDNYQIYHNGHNKHDYKFIISQAIRNAYIELIKILIYNKLNDLDNVTYYLKSITGNYASFNLRDDDKNSVINSAATDKTILENATDMAALLATTKSFLSNIPEFDSLNNQ